MIVGVDFQQPRHAQAANLAFQGRATIRTCTKTQTDVHHGNKAARTQKGAMGNPRSGDREDRSERDEKHGARHGIRVNRSSGVSLYVTRWCFFVSKRRPDNSDTVYCIAT